MSSCASQPFCWTHAARCDMSEWGRAATSLPCDQVASYCDMRSRICRGTRVPHPRPNMCVDWSTMRSRPLCFLTPLQVALFAILTSSAVALAGAQRGVPPRLQARGKVREGLAWSSWCVLSLWILAVALLLLAG